ncbi:imidazolonepropionase [Parabacteroides sp. PF5-5]|uniref:imidazolonepropionase n=1 Tax=unclassified Parabacteroides TaxID=2649774 RepID=UPI002476363D|nr:MULTISPECIES: imidazolonepropionase [unclassified Parabacteroides]MDH6304977.1 imidazolonepropionase [Parabacteroides sp. PH5-39]MDH6315938.1 imidazolonepropionase [Parabacteroides sp. PF5-13]MDH6319595.1 imidazolonepropionase [Parabacteroides sp. PH5-13]MDH6323326.1 imidazolonepropionase [Parabacteroides sp. PH5-8]MDH6327166.1 imidazolonepropionase [Parabacteroides sp. PH5-41]
MKTGKLLIKNTSQLVTCSGFAAKKGKAMSDLGVIENGAVAISNGIITHVGTTEEVLSQLNEDDYSVIDASGKALLPGFVDSHTHFVFGGYREEEFSWRLRGDSYMSIMERGGGIVNTMQATRNSTYDDLWESAYARLDDMLDMGVTTVEGKSGYGLDLETELKQLRVMEELNEEHPVDIVSTFLGAHAVPPEYKGKADEYIDYIIQTILPAVQEEDLAEFCDVFCEKGVFSIEQSERLLKAAEAHGMKPKLHADEIVDIGGAELAVRLKATSADHLLQASDENIRLLAKSDTIATLLPLTAFSLKESYARGREMIDAGCAVALASDLNPGSCFSGSIPLLIALACIYMKLTPEEVVTALTINGAAALGRAESIGSIDVGKKADMIILRYPSYKFLSYHIGINIVTMTIKDGKITIND